MSRGGSGSCRQCRAPRRFAAVPTRSSCARAVRCTASTPARSGRSCARSCRPSSRRASTRATSTWESSRRPSTTPGRSRKRSGRSSVPGRVSRARWASRRRRSWRRWRPTGASRVGSRWCVRAGRPRSSPRSRRGSCPESARVQPSGSPRPGSRRSAGSLRWRTTSFGECSRARSGCSCATARAASTRGGWRSRPSASRSRAKRHSSATSARSSGSTTSCAGWRAGSLAT